MNISLTQRSISDLIKIYYALPRAKLVQKLFCFFRIFHWAQVICSSYLAHKLLFQYICKFFLSCCLLIIGLIWHLIIFFEKILGLYLHLLTLGEGYYFVISVKVTFAGFITIYAFQLILQHLRMINHFVHLIYFVLFSIQCCFCASVFVDVSLIKIIIHFLFIILPEAYIFFMIL